MREVYNLQNLHEARDLPCPAKLAVIGFPVKHSASPRMHQAVLDAHNKKISYIRLEVQPGQILEAFECLQKQNFIGCNVTVPHKFDALAACDFVSNHAKLLGSVNTISFKKNGTHGTNTDGPGIEAAILEEFSRPLAQYKVVLLGAGGGAGQAIATQCALAGVPHLTLVNRSLSKITALKERLAEISNNTTFVVSDFQNPGLKSICHQAGLIIQTTSLGLKKSDPPVIPASYLSVRQNIYDTIYEPAVTPFLASAAAAGCAWANGQSLLIHQGALAFKTWFPDTDPLPIMKSALLPP